jgi:hypothetical protein
MRTGKKGLWPVNISTIGRVILYLCALALVALAAFQATDPPPGETVAMGVGTKALTALIAIVVARLAQPPSGG